MYRASKILGLPMSEAFYLDAAEIFRACSFASAENMASNKANWKPE